MANGQDSRRRLLAAATTEFAAFGIAGARVDRIVAAARVNKAQLYAWYGSKDRLFDVVLQENLSDILDAVPVTGDDLPGYAARLYDAYVTRPELVRLAAWARLERVPSGDLFGHLNNHDQAKIRTIMDAQLDNQVDPHLDPADVLSLITGLALTWSPVSLLTTATADEESNVHRRRKQALTTAARRAFRPAPADG